MLYIYPHRGFTKWTLQSKFDHWNFRTSVYPLPLWANFCLLESLIGTRLYSCRLDCRNCLGCRSFFFILNLQTTISCCTAIPCFAEIKVIILMNIMETSRIIYLLIVVTFIIENAIISYIFQLLLFSYTLIIWKLRRIICEAKSKITPDQATNLKIGNQKLLVIFLCLPI